MSVKVTPENFRDLYREKRISMLSWVEEACTALSRTGGTREDFLSIVHYCKQSSLIDDTKLAAWGGITKATANRWSHGKAAPHSATLRKIIFESIAGEARRRVGILHEGGDEFGLPR